MMTNIILPSTVLGLITYFLRPLFYDFYIIIRYGSDYYAYFKTATITKFTIGNLEVVRGSEITLYLFSEYSWDVKRLVTGTIIGKSPEKDVLYLKADNGDVIGYSAWAISKEDIVSIH